MKTRQTKVKVKYCENPSKVENIKIQPKKKKESLGKWFILPDIPKGQILDDSEEIENICNRLRSGKLDSKTTNDLREKLNAKRRAFLSEKMKELGPPKRVLRSTKKNTVKQILKHQILQDETIAKKKSKKNSKKSKYVVSRLHPNKNHTPKPTNDENMKELLKDISQGNGIFDKTLTGNQISKMLVQTQPNSSIVALPGKIQIALKGNLQVDLQGKLTVNLFADLSK